MNEFSAQRDATLAQSQEAADNERLGFLVHELRNNLGTVSMALTALETGPLPINGSTGAVLKRGLGAMTTMLNSAVSEVRLTAGSSVQTEALSVAALVEDAKNAAALYASASGCVFVVPEVDKSLVVTCNHDLLLAALLNLLQNAFKFTHSNTAVTLKAHADGERVSIDVKDNCGGLAPGTIERMFMPSCRPVSTEADWDWAVRSRRRALRPPAVS